MKKIMLLPLLVLLFSCSVDDSSVNWQNEGETSSVIYYGEREGFTEKADNFTSCFNLEAGVSVDVSGGFTNPVVVFTSVINTTVPATKRFRVRLEVEPLSNCDNMNSTTGNLIVFGPTAAVQNVQVNPPSFSVQPSQLPLCYKWRIVFDGSTDAARGLGCYSYSSWYESPIF